MHGFLLLMSAMSSSSMLACGCEFTAAMCDYSLSLHLFQSFLLDQSLDSMESSAYFERADALEVFAFEEEVHFWFSRVLAFPLCSL